MTRLIRITITTLALAAPASAIATPEPSRRDVHRAIRAYTRDDHPSSVTVRHCRRTSRFAVSCHVTEHNVVTMWTLNGQPLVCDIDYGVRVVWRRERLRITSSLFAGSVTLAPTRPSHTSR